MVLIQGENKKKERKDGLPRINREHAGDDHAETLEIVMFMRSDLDKGNPLASQSQGSLHASARHQRFFQLPRVRL
jgi:hypothetical protein